ncbi:MAG: hypothetical protein K5795_07095, partial [Lachnospiraceae bacterium]|nr:hypothetical protein [Lachnospiraceae bacterium]
MKYHSTNFYRYICVFIITVLCICFTGCSDNTVQTDDNIERIVTTPVITEEPSNITDEPVVITEPVTAPTEIPSVSPTEKPDIVITDTPEPNVTGINNFPSPEVPDPSKALVFTDLYKLYLPTNWGKYIYYSEDD